MNILRLSTVVALGFAMLSGSALAQQNLSPPQSQIQSPSATNEPDLFLSPVVIPPSQLLPSASTTCSINCDTQVMNCRNACRLAGPVATPNSADTSPCGLTCTTQQLICKQSCGPGQ